MRPTYAVALAYAGVSALVAIFSLGVATATFAGGAALALLAWED